MLAAKNAGVVGTTGDPCSLLLLLLLL
jgi:hypothetical protein